MHQNAVTRNNEEGGARRIEPASRVRDYSALVCVDCRGGNTGAFVSGLSGRCLHLDPNPGTSYVSILPERHLHPSRDRGARATRKAEVCLCESRNPIIQLMYVVLMGTAVYIWYQQVLPVHPCEWVWVCVSVCACVCVCVCLCVRACVCACVC